MAAGSAIIVLIDIFRLLIRSGVIAALLSTQTPAASDHSINHEPPAWINAGLKIAPETGAHLLRRICRLEALSGHVAMSDLSPLSGVKRTLSRHRGRAVAPGQTYSSPLCPG